MLESIETEKTQTFGKMKKSVMIVDDLFWGNESGLRN